jgi:hypothetical protein
MDNTSTFLFFLVIVVVVFFVCAACAWGKCIYTTHVLTGEQRQQLAIAATPSAWAPGVEPSVWAPAVEPLPEVDEASVCVVCQTERRTRGLVHGGTAHYVVCAACAPKCKDCPVCREEVCRVGTLAQLEGLLVYPLSA